MRLLLEGHMNSNFIRGMWPSFFSGEYMWEICIHCKKDIYIGFNNEWYHLDTFNKFCYYDVYGPTAWPQ